MRALLAHFRLHVHFLHTSVCTHALLQLHTRVRAQAFAAGHDEITDLINQYAAVEDKGGKDWIRGSHFNVVMAVRTCSL